MNDVSRHCYVAISLLVFLCLTVRASVGQSPDAQDLLRSLPNADAVITIDAKRVTSELLPHLLADEPALRPLVMSLIDLKTLTGFDPQAIERIAVGLRYTDSGFKVVAIAQSSEATRVPAIIRQMGSGTLYEQQHEGKKLFLVQTNFAIAPLNENTIVFGHLADVRACIDLSAGKSKGVSAEHVAAMKSNPKALLTAAGRLPTSLTEGSKEFGHSDLTEIIAALKWFSASVELSSGGLEVVVKLTAGSPEHAKNLAEVLGAMRTLSTSVAGRKTSYDKLTHELMRGLVASSEANELQVRDVFTQATLNRLAKLIASETYNAKGFYQMDPGAAIVEYEKAIMLMPDNAYAILNHGKANSDKGNLDAAIADYDKVIAIEPSWSLPYNNRGFTRLKKEQFDAAIVDLEKAIELNPTDPYAYNNRGQALYEKGELERAMADFDKSIALDASNAFAFTNRGHARQQKGDIDGALADFDRAITLNPKNIDAYNGRGLVRYIRYYQTGSDQELDQAIDDYNKGIGLTSDDAVLYSNRGYALTEKKDYTRALADFDKSLALNPKLAPAYNGRGLLRFSKEEFDLAIADYDRAVALDPNSAEYYGNRALSRLAIRLDEQAAQDLKKCYELDESMREVLEPQITEIKKTRRAKPRRP